MSRLRGTLSLNRATNGVGGKTRPWSTRRVHAAECAEDVFTPELSAYSPLDMVHFSFIFFFNIVFVGNRGSRVSASHSRCNDSKYWFAGYKAVPVKFPSDGRSMEVSRAQGRAGSSSSSVDVLAGSRAAAFQVKSLLKASAYA